MNFSLGDSKEGYYIGVEAPKDSHRASLCFYGPNIWPSEGMNLLFRNLQAF